MAVIKILTHLNSYRYFNMYWQKGMLYRGKDNGHDIFPTFSETYVVDTHWNDLYEAIPMCTDKVSFQLFESFVADKHKFRLN